MRATYLIARREYLSYVATWGFWLSLLAVPFFATIGAATPALIESSQPTRYYVIIDETGQDLDRVIDTALIADRRASVRMQLSLLARTMGGEEAEQRALAAFDADPTGLSGLEPALAAAGLEDAAGALDTGRTRAVRVPAPADTIESLRPFLSGEQTIETDEGPKELFAAFILQPHSERGIEISYLSANLTNNELRGDVRSIVREYMRESALLSEGLSMGDIDRVFDLNPLVTSLDARADAEDGAEVTIADRAPFFISIAIAFILWMAVFSVANMLLTSLIEEKGGKIIELLLSTARFHEILIGKLAGVAAVTMTLFVVWGLVGGVLATLGGAAIAAIDPDLLTLLAAFIDPGLLLAALFFFACGYLMYGAIFLALGSLCDTLQDAQTLMGPIIWMLMLPVLILFFSLEALDSMVIQIASWFPLWTPFLMMARLPTEPPLLELIGACALMLATTVAVVWGAAMVFRQGALRQADADSVRRWFKLGRKKGA